jgi:hypothetical protein
MERCLDRCQSNLSLSRKENVSRSESYSLQFPFAEHVCNSVVSVKTLRSVCWADAVENPAVRCRRVAVDRDNLTEWSHDLTVHRVVIQTALRTTARVLRQDIHVAQLEEVHLIAVGSADVALRVMPDAVVVVRVVLDAYHLESKVHHLMGNEVHVLPLMLTAGL